MRRKKIQRQIIKIFYRLGIYIDIEFFPSVEKVYHRISHKPAQKQIAELEKICTAVSAAKDHKYYNQLLKKFIPAWDLKIENAKFLSQGLWSGFNSYRKVEFQENQVFEKLFDSNSEVLDKLLWLEKQIFPLIKDKIKTPKITKFYRAEVLSLAYFEFINAAAFPEKKGEKQAVEVSKYLYEFSLKTDFSTLNPPSHLSDFKNYSRYKMWQEKAKKDLKNQHISANLIENKIAENRKILTHGDLKDLNLFKDGNTIDWDESGFFPAGLEQAFIYSRNILFYDLVKNSPFEWLSKNFKSVIPPKEWKSFRLSFAYFLFIFSYEKLNEEKYQTIKKEILTDLKIR